MPLQVVVGPAFAGAEEFIRHQSFARARAGGRVLLLLPSARDVSRVTDELGAQVALGVQVRTFDNHLDALWGQLGDGRSIITPVQQLVMLEESTTLWHPQSPGLLSESRGVVRALKTVVQRAAEVQWTPVRAGEGEKIGADLLECAVIYEELLGKAGLIERSAAHRLVCERLREIEPPSLVAVEGFSSLTRAQERFITSLAVTTDVIIGLVFDDKVPAAAAGAALVQRLSTSGEVRHADAVIRDIPGEIARIGDSLAAPVGQPLQPAGALLLSEAWGAQAEAARIVNEIQDALAEGVSPGEIAVVFRRVGPHMRQLKVALEEAGVVAEFDAGIPFGSTGLGRALLLLLGLGAAAGPYRALVDVLRSPYGPTPHDVLDALDAQVRRTREDRPGQIETWLRRRHPESAAFIARARAASGAVGEVGAERRWYQLVNEMLRRAHPKVAGPTPELSADAATARDFMAAVTSIGGLGAAGSRAATLASALREAQVMVTSSERSDRVQVMGAERVRGGRYERIIIGGLVMGEFPGLSGQDALSAPGVTAFFQRAGIDLAPRSDVSAERLLFYLAATRATRTLVLSWQSHDAEGRPLRPSIFLDEVLDLYRGAAGDPELPEGPPLSVLRLDTHDEREGAPQSVRRALRTRIARPTAGAETLAVVDARRRAHHTREPAPQPEAVRHMNSERTVFSASEIETYLQCPYRWFVERMVRPRELDERFDRSAAGRLAHEIMKRFYDTYVARTGLPRLTPESIDVAREIHAEVAQVALAEAGATSAAEVAATRATARQTLRLVEADATLFPGFVPAFREWSFGAGEDPPEDFGSFALAGRVDRIDVTDAELIVTDYKPGTQANGRAAAKFAEEGIVQAPLYAAVARRRLERRIAGALYRPVGGGKPRGFVDESMAGAAFVRTDVRSAAGIEELIAGAITRAEEAVTGMRAGEIQARPRTATCPSFCAARGFCAEWRQGRA